MVLIWRSSFEAGHHLFRGASRRAWRWRVLVAGPLRSSERSDAPGGLRPEITVSLKGSIEAPDRTLDTASFTHWLALRAVEQQTKRLDALESGHDSQTVTGAAATTPAPVANAPVPNGPAE